MRNHDVIRKLFACCIAVVFVLFSPAQAQGKSPVKQLHNKMRALGMILEVYSDENGNKYPDQEGQLVEGEYLLQKDLDGCKNLYYAGKGLKPKDKVPDVGKGLKENILAIAMNTDKSHYIILYVDGSVTTSENEKDFKTSEEVYKSFK